MKTINQDNLPQYLAEVSRERNALWNALGNLLSAIPEGTLITFGAVMDARNALGLEPGQTFADISGNPPE